MKSFSPSYLYQNRFGIWYFRARIPLRIRKIYKVKQTEIRQSLRTRDRKIALQRTRLIWTIMDKTDWLNRLEAWIEMDEEDLKESRILLIKLNDIENDPYSLAEDIHEFLLTLTESQERNLWKANEYFSDNKEPNSSGEYSTPTRSVSG